MKNLLFVMIVAAASLLTAGCVSHMIVDSQPPAVAAGESAPQVAAPQMSPDINFKASNTLPGEPSL